MIKAWAEYLCQVSRMLLELTYCIETLVRFHVFVIEEDVGQTVFMKLKGKSKFNKRKE